MSDQVDDPDYSPSEGPPTDDSVSSGYREDEDGNTFLEFREEALFTNKDGVRIHPYFHKDSLEEMRSDLKGRIGFRVYNELTQGKNGPEGFFAALSRPYEPPSRNDYKYMVDVVYHLQRVKVSTPFISIWKSIVSALQKLITIEFSEIAFINLHSMAGERMPYFGEQRIKYPRVVRAQSLIWQYQIKKIGFPDGTRYRYKGDFEYLCWQQVHQQYIISTISREEFELHLRQNPDLYEIMEIDELKKHKDIRSFFKQHQSRVLRNYRAGYAIGVFLQRVAMPPDFIQYMAKEFANQFKFGWLKQEKKLQDGKRDRYLEGIWTGFKSQPLRAGDTTPASLKREPLLINEVANANEVIESPSIAAARRRARNQARRRDVRRQSAENVPRTVLFRSAIQEACRDEPIQPNLPNSRVARIRQFVYPRNRASNGSDPLCTPLAPANVSYFGQRDHIAAQSSSDRPINTQDEEMQDFVIVDHPPNLKAEPETDSDRCITTDNAGASFEDDWIVVEENDVTGQYGSSELMMDTVNPNEQVSDSVRSPCPLIQNHAAVVTNEMTFPSDIVPDVEYFGFEGLYTPRIQSDREFSLCHRQFIKHVLGYDEYHGPGTE